MSIVIVCISVLRGRMAIVRYIKSNHCYHHNHYLFPVLDSRGCCIQRILESHYYWLTCAVQVQSVTSKIIYRLSYTLFGYILILLIMSRDTYIIFVLHLRHMVSICCYICTCIVQVVCIVFFAEDD